MQSDAVVDLDSAARPPDKDDLVEGLVLVRASTLKLARLQLALERHDRRVALEAVDDLVRFDQSLEQHLSSLRDPHEHSVMDLAVAVERAALNREKLTLAAEIISNGSDAPDADPPFPEEQVEAVEVPPVDESSAENPVEEAFPAEQWFDAWEEEPRSRRAVWWLLAAVLLLTAIGTAIWWIGVSTTIGWLEAARAALLRLVS